MLVGAFVWAASAGALETAHVIALRDGWDSSYYAPLAEGLLGANATRIWAVAGTAEGACPPSGLASVQARALSHLRVLDWVARQPGQGWHLVLEDRALPSSWVLRHQDWPQRADRRGGRDLD